jgi:hypothetical protein
MAKHKPMRFTPSLSLYGTMQDVDSSGLRQALALWMLMTQTSGGLQGNKTNTTSLDQSTNKGLDATQKRTTGARDPHCRHTH